MRTSLIVPAIGSVMEWTSFFSAGILSAIYLVKIYGIVIAFFVFLAGLIGRPLGAFIFGVIGDKLGRKPALLLAIFLLSLGNLEYSR